MNSRPRSWGYVVLGLIAAVISLQVLADVLPRVLPSLVVLAAVFVVVRLVLFHTRKW